jgi:hypothetical protein
MLDFSISWGRGGSKEKNESGKRDKKGEVRKATPGFDM